VSRFVVDASVAFKWFLPEDHMEAARRLLDGSHTLLVPDLLYVEFGNILWKRVQRGEMTEAEALAPLGALGALPLETHSSWPLVLPALEIACRTGRTVYDSLYLALAVREHGVMVTADRKFYDLLQVSALSSHVRWVADAP
jgi:predicted nucleic acid-binding protein